MMLPDVNIFIYAFRSDIPQHTQMRDWLNKLVHGEQAFAVSDLVLSAFLRIVTNPKAFKDPESIEDAIDFVEKVRSEPKCVVIAPGPRHWAIFTSLCRQVRARGNLVPDAFLAALAIESGSEFVTTDRDYSRFPGLRWRHPLE